MKAKSLLLPKKNQAFLVIMIITILLAMNARAANRYCKVTGNWNSTTTWAATTNGTAGVSVPVAGDSVYIERGRIVTIDAGYAAECALLSVGSNVNLGSAGLIFSIGSTLVVSGDVQIGGSAGTSPNYAAGTVTFASGAVMTVAGAITIGINDLNHSGSLIFTAGGLLKVGSTFTVNYLGSFAAGTGTIEYNGSSAQTVSPNNILGTYNNLTLSGSGVKTTTTVSVNGIISMEGTATASYQITAGSAATLQYKGSSAQITGPEFGTLAGNPANRTFGGIGGVIINNPNGVSLGSNSSIAKTLTLTSGNFNVGSNKLTLLGPAIAGTGSNLQTTSNSSLAFVSNTAGLYIPSSVSNLYFLSIISSSGLLLNSSVSCNTVELIGKISTGSNVLGAATITGAPGTLYYVYGNLRHTFSSSELAFFFPVGDATNYTPANITFDDVTTGGDLTVHTTAGLHPNYLTAGLLSATVLNRYWTATNSGIIFPGYSAEFTFVAGDIRGGANTANFVVRKYASGWTAPTTPTKNLLSTVATGMTSFSDYVLGIGYAAANLSTLTPSTSTIIANGTSTQKLTVTAKDAYGNLIGGGGAVVTITKNSGTGTISSVTDVGDGTYTAWVTSPITIGSGTFVATLDGGQVKSGAATQTISTVNYVAGPALASMSTLTPVSATIIANGTSTVTLTITAYDANGNRVTSGGDYVELYGISGSCSGSGGQWADATNQSGNIGFVTDNGDGTYTILV
ncbi:MAG: invasin domain 3-containing protein, partial [Bacteroidales bacterium]